MGDGASVTKLYLIRHGETVDNVKGLYAGVRDSALTVHGVQQAARLGEFFAQHGIKLTNIFSSDLSRARKTAEAICNAQKEAGGLSVVPLTVLQEQDFGYYEGKPFQAKPRNSNQSGKDAHCEAHRSDPGFKDIESKESMASRADWFLDLHLMPLLTNKAADHSATIAVVSHGMLLSSLWKRMLKRQKPGTVIIHQELLADQRPLSLEHIGGWSNTGYLELHLQQAPGAPMAAEANGKPTDEVPVKDSTSLVPMTMVIVGINKKLHLTGLKRTRGGLGSAAFDEGQKSIDTFFKKQKQ